MNGNLLVSLPGPSYPTRIGAMGAGVSSNSLSSADSNGLGAGWLLDTGPTRSFSYDTDGEMTARGSDTISWDGWGRTTGGTFSGTAVTYVYDAAGDLRSRSRSGQTLRYLLGGIFETHGSGTLTTSYADGPVGDLATYAGAPST